jgi:hypothetical protein
MPFNRWLSCIPVKGTGLLTGFSPLSSERGVFLCLEGAFRLKEINGFKRNQQL